MSDLIYRHEAIKTITSYNGTVDKSVAKRLLLQMPSAEPRKKGKWIDKSDDIDGAWNYCSVCGEEVWDMEWCNSCGQHLSDEYVEVENEN